MSSPLMSIGALDVVSKYPTTTSDGGKAISLLQAASELKLSAYISLSFDGRSAARFHTGFPMLRTNDMVGNHFSSVE